MLVDPASPRSLTQVARDSCCTPRGLGARRKSYGTAGKTPGPSDPRPCGPGELVDPQARRAPSASSGTADRPRGPSYLRPSHPGELVHTSGHWNTARVALDSSSTLRAFGPGREASGTSAIVRVVDQLSRATGDWNPVLGHPGHLVDPAGPGTRARVTRDSWLTPWTLREWPELPWKVGRTPGLSELGRSPWDSWLTPRALGHVRESRGKAGQHCGNSDTGTSRPGQLEDTADPRICSRVARDSWLTPRALGTGLESPGRAGRPRRPPGVGPSHRGQLVDPAGTRTIA